ncbi:MAG: exodeoxyribonuclease VII large subunit [Patescibacteria group bacterium]|nr:exodeoxyribonuclease VII large subunit [Patescibacteria group bacterium]
MNDQILSVSELSDYINQTLEYAYPSVVVEGEVSSFKISQGKWVFFDIKDSQTTLGCFMSIYQLNTPLEDGMLVRVVAQPKLTTWGKFSLTVKSVELAGEGSVKKAFELLKLKLEKEGLFALDRKRQLPQYPKKVALVTSKQAAAYNDFVTILQDRWGGVVVDHLQVQVQGSSAPQQIVEAIEYFNIKAADYDALVIIRGGGSAEDLQAFQTEPVARAIYSSEIATVVAIGHEDDISLAELVADLRAATPTDAARLLVPDKKSVITQLEASISLQSELTLKILQRESDKLTRFHNSLRFVIDSAVSDLSSKQYRLNSAISTAINSSHSEFAVLSQKLTSLSPQSVLDRGYAVVSYEGHSVSSSSALKNNDNIMVQLAQGKLTAKIIEIDPK